jgi:hypothetical protein
VSLHEKSSEAFASHGSVPWPDFAESTLISAILGELNGCQEASWRRTMELFGQDHSAPQQASFLPETHLPKTQDPLIPFSKGNPKGESIRPTTRAIDDPCWIDSSLITLSGDGDPEIGGI